MVGPLNVNLNVSLGWILATNTHHGVMIAMLIVVRNLRIRVTHCWETETPFGYKASTHTVVSGKALDTDRQLFFSF